MIDEREVDDVRAWLATADASIRPLDLGYTVEAGRARVRRRRIGRIAGTGALALALLAGVPGMVALVKTDGTDQQPTAAVRTPPPDGPFACTFQALPAPQGIDPSTFNLDIRAIDPSGRYVIGAAKAKGEPFGISKSLLWDNGVGKVLAPEELAHSIPTAVSENGVVAGSYQPTAHGQRGDGRAWIYRNGAVTHIPVPAGARGVAIVDIDKNGDLLGSVTTAGTMKAAVWRASDLAKPEFLEAPGEIVEPVRFLADGGIQGRQIVESKLYVWNAQRQGTAYTSPEGVDGPSAVLTSDGWVHAAGHRPGREEMIAARWNLDTGEVQWPELPTVTPPVDYVLLKGIARNGALLYASGHRMFVVRGDHVAELPAPDGLQAYAEHIDEFGTKIAGRVSRGSNSLEGLSMAVWTC